MNYYLAKCSELNFLLCIQHGLWAQQRNRMSGWRPKDRLILYTQEGIVGLFEVTSDQFEDDVRVWPDKVYPFRVNINSLKVLSPQNRLSLKERGIDKELVHLYGTGWGMKVVMQLKPIDSMLAKKIENLILAQPAYDPLPTMEEDIRKLAAATPKSPHKYIKREKREPLETTEVGEKSLHGRTIEMLVEIGRWEGKHSESEYPIGNLGRLDVVWKRIQTGNPSYAFEVQDKGNFYQALAKLKHAFDLWNSTPVLVTSEQFMTQAEELLSGSFHEMRRQARVINFQKIQELFSLEERLHKLKDELDL